jgi:hypothetical protein
MVGAITDSIAAQISSGLFEFFGKSERIRRRHLGRTKLDSSQTYCTIISLSNVKCTFPFPKPANLTQLFLVLTQSSGKNRHNRIACRCLLLQLRSASNCPIHIRLAAKIAKTKDGFDDACGHRARPQDSMSFENRLSYLQRRSPCKLHMAIKCFSSALSSTMALETRNGVILCHESKKPDRHPRRVLPLFRPKSHGSRRRGWIWLVSRALTTNAAFLRTHPSSRAVYVKWSTKVSKLLHPSLVDFETIGSWQFKDAVQEAVMSSRLRTRGAKSAFCSVERHHKHETTTRCKTTRSSCGL